MKTHYDISLMDEKLIKYIEENQDGLCMKKFHADIITNNIDYFTLKPGDIIEVNNRKIRLIKVGKSCFSECKLNNKPCPLSKNVAFGEDV